MNGTVNKVILMGRLGDAVKLSYFSQGNCVGRFPLATDHAYIHPATGERVVTTEWHNIVVRNKVAETFEKYLSKGDMVYLEGRLKTRKWQSQDGVTHYTTEVYVIEFQFVNNKKNETTSSEKSNSVTHINTDDYPI